MIAEQNAPRLIRLLPLAVAATWLVAGIPVVVVWALRVTGLVSSPLLATACGMVVSLAGSCLGALWWERRRRSGDVLFGDLMLWGWVRRYLIERRLASALELLGLDRGRAAARELTFTTERFSAERHARALEQLAASLEARDPYTHGHSRRVARYATMIARRMGLAQLEVARVRAAAAMHDVGKIETPIALLHKPGQLTDAEFDTIKRHPVDGARMVAAIGDEELTAIVRHHHERLDGTGYPSGLSGSAIPLGARIIAVADTFDAITSERPYRPARAHKQAIEIMRREAGEQLDPDAVHAFRSLYFGRRSLGLWIGATNAFERFASWLAVGTVGSTARVAAIAASTAALGAGAVAVPVSATRSSLRPVRAQVAAAGGGSVRPRGPLPIPLAAHRGRHARVLRGSGQRRRSPASPPAGAGTASGTSKPVATGGPGVAPGASPGAPPAAGTSADSSSAGGRGTGGGSGSGSGGSSRSGAGTPVVSTGSVPVPGVPAVGVTVRPAPASGGLPSVGVTVGGTTAASAGGTTSGGVGVSAGGARGVAVTVGGSGSPGVGVTIGGVNVKLP